MVQNASVVDYDTFEDYLDAQITDVDMFYLEDKDLARQLVELGYRGSGEPLKREEFDARKKLLTSTGVPLAGNNAELEELVSLGTESYWKNDAFLCALAEREEVNRSGKMMTIIFIRTCNTKGIFDSPGNSHIQVKKSRAILIYRTGINRKILTVNF